MRTKETDLERAETLRDEPFGSAEALQSLDFEERYELGEPIGEGGMGVVLLTRDRQIGRRVAMKVMHTGSGDEERARRRFLIEARVQGQLEHPSVVPVYDLGVDPQGQIYFTMKRVRGHTLATIFEVLREASGAGAKQWSRRRLLTAFSQVCLAIDFAHEHGIFHRDIKPSNVMLGDYGEVYVLDWGVAKVRGAIDVAEGVSFDLQQLDTPEAATVPGTLLGTPGYMSPEQLRGEHDHLGAPADIYSLGAVLFELLTLTKLHPRGSFGELAVSTLRGTETRPSVRAPEREIAPELDEIAVRATRIDPAERYASAREMHDAIERYLDGERDQSLRLELATDHAQTAARHAERATASRGPSALNDRRRAMREVGRALALDPENELALRTMVDLLSRPPADTPDEIDREIEASQFEQTRWIGRVGGVAYAVVLPMYLAFFLWAGIHDWSAILAFQALLLLAAATSVTASVLQRPPIALVLAIMILSDAAFSTLAASFGPWLVTPTLVAINTAAFALHLTGWGRVLSVAIGCLAVIAPVILQLAGALPASHAFRADGMVISEGALGFPPTAMTAMLTAIAVGSVVTGGLAVARVRDVLNATERKLHLYTWHMRQLVRPR